MLDTSEVNARQVARRAREHLDSERSAPASPAQQRRLLESFVAAARVGDLDGLERLLVDDVVVRPDGGGEVHASRVELVGAARTVTFLDNILRKYWQDSTLRIVEANGGAALLVTSDDRRAAGDRRAGRLGPRDRARLHPGQPRARCGSSRPPPDVVSRSGALRGREGVTHMKKIVIVGGGYAGFYAAWNLEKTLRPDEAEITVIDPRPYMTYQPFLPEVMAGSVEARHAAVSLRRHLRRTQGGRRRGDPGRARAPDAAGPPRRRRRRRARLRRHRDHRRRGHPHVPHPGDRRAGHRHEARRGGRRHPRHAAHVVRPRLRPAARTRSGSGC